jgi:hypothetical protein
MRVGMPEGPGSDFCSVAYFYRYVKQSGQFTNTNEQCWTYKTADKFCKIYDTAFCGQLPHFCPILLTEILFRVLESENEEAARLLLRKQMQNHVAIRREWIGC